MKKLLVIYGAEAGQVATTHQFVDAFRQHSRFEVSYLCVEQAPGQPVDLSRYDAVWVNYCAGLALESERPNAVPESLRDSLAAYHGAKLVALQDEYDRTNRLRQELIRIGATAILTCVPQDSLEYVYPRSMFTNVRFETVLTGYVPDDLLQVDGIRPLAERPIVVGYRGRDLGARYGELARQKAEIGLRLRKACFERGIPCDIAIDEASRIYGPAWFDFVKSCRVMLGTESGSNVFDFDGALARLYREMKAADANLSYDSFRPFTATREREIDMAQISPRVFEAAALRTPMVLLRGRYSGLLQPDEHYIALEPDYSNLDGVLERIRDMPTLEAMAQRAHRDLIGSGAHTYEAFVSRMDAIIEGLLRDRPPPESAALKSPLHSIPLNRRPLGHDPYLLGENARLRNEIVRLQQEHEQRLTTALERERQLLKAREDAATLSNLYEGRLRAAYGDIDRLLGELHARAKTVDRSPLLRLMFRLDALIQAATHKVQTGCRYLRLRS